MIVSMMGESLPTAAKARCRPTLGSAARSLTAVTNLVGPLVMTACLFFPHSLGADDTAYRPLAWDRIEEGKWVIASHCLWPFVWAIGTAAMILALVVVRPPRPNLVLLAVPVALAAVLSFGWFLVLFSEIDGSRAAMAIGAIVVPLGTLVALRMFWLFQAGQRITAAVWGQGFLAVMAIFSLRWFWWPPVAQLLPAGWISIAAAGWMLIASWTWPRATHDFADRSVAPPRFQVSLTQIVAAILLVAVALTYWRILAG
jgi:hypothetical protein